MNQSFPILLIEDDEDDVFFLRKALAKLGRADCLTVVNDGAEALGYFIQCFQTALDPRLTSSLPKLVLLDLNIPKRSGLEVLEWLREQAGSNQPPVAVFSSSPSERDIREAYRLGANFYLFKPSDPAKIADLLRPVMAWVETFPDHPGESAVPVG